MARKDIILRNFLEHEIIRTKYGLDNQMLPENVRKALSSDKPIIKTIAIIVDALDGSSEITDSTLRNQVFQYLNTAAL